MGNGNSTKYGEVTFWSALFFLLHFIIIIIIIIIIAVTNIFIFI